MKVIKGFKLANTVLATALALALSGCGDDPISQLITPTTPDTTTTTPDTTTTDPDAGTNNETIFADAAKSGWETFDCCAESEATFPIETAGDHGVVTEFSIGDYADTVLGFRTAAPLDVSAIAATGTLDFDIKIVTAADTEVTRALSTTKWFVKLESNGGTDAPGSTGENAQVELTALEIGVWKSISVDLAELENQGLDLTAIDNVMIFPEWGQGAGSVYRVDNLAFNENAVAPVVDPVVDPVDPGDTGTSIITNGDFETALGGEWFFELAGGTPTIIDGELAIVDLSAGGNPWEGRLVQNTDTVIVNGATYKISFDARAEEARSINVQLGKLFDADPYFAPFMEDAPVALTTTMESYEIEVTANNPDGLTADLIFALGAGADTLVTFDNISITEVTVVDPVDPVADYDIDFEGTPLVWETFENTDNPALEFVSNPDATGINSSATVAKFTARADGAMWAGTQTFQYEPFTWDESNCVVKMMVYKDKISDVGVKLATASNWSSGEIKVSNTLTNEWEELTFDFCGRIGETADPYAELAIFPDFIERDVDTVAYFDNISFSGNGTVAPVAPVDPVDPVAPVDPVDPIAGIDFEGDTQLIWGEFEGADALEFVANPVTDSAVNMSDTVAMASISQAAQPWAGFNTTGLASFKLDSSNCIIKIMVFKDTISPVGIKLEQDNGTGMGSHGEILVSNTKINEWEELTFDFSSQIDLPETQHVDGFVVFPDFTARTGDTVNYFDNITFSAQ